MPALPKHVERGLRELIEDGVPADEIAYMMELTAETVAEEIEHLAENRKAPPGNVEESLTDHSRRLNKLR
jgi:hypothetical protein